MNEICNMSCDLADTCSRKYQKISTLTQRIVADFFDIPKDSSAFEFGFFSDMPEWYKSLYRKCASIWSKLEQDYTKSVGK